MPATALNSPSVDFDAELSPDGGWVVFSSHRIDGVSSDIFFAGVSGDTFLTPQPATMLNHPGSFDEAPTFDPSGTTLYFTSDASAGTHLWTATFSNGVFGTPAMVSELASMDMAGSTVSPDGLELWFNDNGDVTSRLFRSTRPNPSAPWGAPAMVPELASVAAGWPAFSADGLDLYFEGDVGSMTQLYVVSRASLSEPFGVPRALSELGDPAVSEGDPYISRDGQTFLFASERAGLPDIYVARRTCQ